MAEQFGARVSFNLRPATPCQLFLMRSHPATAPLAGWVRARGGKVVLQGSGWMLAELGLQDAMEMRKFPGIFFVGGVSVDPKRFELFRRVAGLDPPSQ